MQTRSSRKRKLDEEKDQPNKHRKTEDDEDDALFNEKFEYFLDLPVELQTEIYQRCTLSVKIHFNEVCRDFRNTGGWLRELVFPQYPIVGFDLKPSILTRFSSLKRLCYNNVSFTQDLSQYVQYLTALEELRFDINSTAMILPAIGYLTNLRKLSIPECKWADEDSFGQFTRLTGLRSLFINCSPFLVEYITAFKHLTDLRCIVQIPKGVPQRPMFDLFTKLKRLQINSNGYVMEMSQLTQLEALKLFDAEFEEINSLQNFQHLTQLEIGTYFKSKTVDLTFKMPQVKYLSLRYLSNVSEAFLSNFPNLTTFKIRGSFILPPNAEQLKKLSVGSIDYTNENIRALLKLTNLQSLSLHGSFITELIKENCNLPLTIRELSLEESNSTNENIMPYLTKLSNLERVTLCDVTPVVGSDVEEEIKSFLKSMPQLKSVYFKGIFSSLMTFQKHKSWFNFLRKNRIHADVVFE